MIEINLAPEHLKIKKKADLLGGLKIPPEIVVGSAGILFMLLILLHAGLLILNMKNLAVHQLLKKEWDGLAAQKQQVDTVLTELRNFQNKLNQIGGLQDHIDVSWSQKLNIVSNSLPREVWLRKIALTDERLFIEGTAISRAGREMNNVHEFISNLKTKEEFLESLYSLELGSIQRRNIGRIEVADFLLTASAELEEDGS